ncbi:hypothetical protein BRLA_c028720 [Brevibacillus laterosporus LMG 15441]|uniref:Uncharacterized protein n=1 Tax=Brevibacillus laterosporus LMG 15441 TaxID=1042163 RepID=A0A075R6W7_BRELA|nr:hypothetical protein BRLA_c028720 [Brevibacillus laterosporus LMG 15441]
MLVNQILDNYTFLSHHFAQKISMIWVIIINIGYITKKFIVLSNIFLFTKY